MRSLSMVSFIAVATCYIAGCSAGPAAMEVSQTEGAAYRVSPAAVTSEKEGGEAESVRPAIAAKGHGPAWLAGESVVWIDTGSDSLGAFELELEFDPREVQVESISTERLSGFSGTLLADPASFGTGKTAIAGFQVSGEFSEGRIAVARLRFEAGAAFPRPFAVRIKALYSPDGKPVRGSASVEAVR